MEGQLKDISDQGLSVEYTGGACIKVGAAIKITILDESTRIRVVDSIACMPVYDLLTLAQSNSFSGKTMRMSGMAFIYDNGQMVFELMRNQILHNGT